MKSSKFVTKIINTTIKQGETATIECQIDALPLPTIPLLRNGKSLTPKDVNDDTYELVISNVTLEDKGNYKVIVLNPLEDKESQCKITVIESTDLKYGKEIKTSDRIEITKKSHGTCSMTIKEATPDDKNVYKYKLNKVLHLIFDCEGLPKPTIKWLFNGQEITPSAKYKIKSKGNINKLTLPKVDLIDTDVYEVIVSNGLETIKAQSKFDVCIKSKVEGKPIDINVNIGEPAKLQCKISASPAPTITWLKVDQPLQPSDNVTPHTEPDATNIGGTTDVKSNLNVQQIKPNLKTDLNKDIIAQSGETIPLIIKALDSEEYQAGITNDIEQVKSKKIKVQIQKAPELKKETTTITDDTTTGKSTLTINQATQKHAGPITLRLENSVATSKPTIKLYKNKIHIALTSDHYELVPSPTDSTTYEIKIKNVRPEDEGNYRIHIENPLASIESNVQVTTVDNVSIKPSSKPNKTDLKQYDTLVLEYIVDGRPKLDITFIKDDKEIKSSPKRQIVYDEKTKVCQLVTTDVEQEDLGTYTLVAKNKLGKKETEPVKVNVTAPIVVKIKLPETIDGVFGKQTTLTVEAEGIPQPKVTWLFNGQPLKTSPKHKIEILKDKPNQTALTVTQLDTTDAGKYTAAIDNGLEKVETNTTLNVHTKPKFESKFEPIMTFNIDFQPIQFDKCICVVIEEYNLYKLVIDDLRSENKETLIRENESSLHLFAEWIIVRL
ncbi:unnamed protein product [Rotaria sp. Silwood1]|nr:unnamed protein product [Rotaria sp. Silwood1]